MDPNATLREIAYQLSRGMNADASIDDSVEHLRNWLANGGFAPDWSAEPLATSYYNTRTRENRGETT